MADFQSSWNDFQAEEIALIAGSVDPLDRAQETADKLGITFPVAFGMDAEEVSRMTGAYYEKDKKFLHAAGFLVRPDHTVEIACYSSGPIGRFAAKDVLNVVKFYKSRK